jgi:putative membrane protein
MRADAPAAPAPPGRALAVSDDLALMRTDLANERTLLAYLRTAATFAAGGIGLARLVTDPAMVRVGWALVPLGALVMAVGAVRFRRTRRLLEQVRATGGAGSGALSA